MESPIIECVECNSILDETWQSNNKNEIICVDCFSRNYSECCDCSLIIKTTTGKKINILDSETIFCESCFNSNFTCCESCNETISILESISGYDKKYCISCYEEIYVRCYYCSESIEIQEAMRDNDGINYCQDCSQRFYINCPICDLHMHRDNSFNFLSNGDRVSGCRECYNNSVIIHNYSYKPNVVFFRQSKKENLFFGIELEVERNESTTPTDVLASKIKKPEFYFKSDGSLTNGFEIVTHPLSYEYIKKNNKLFSELFEKLNTENYKSYESTTCGMHIHLNKNAFNTWHLYRFLDFFKNNKELIIKISQRIEPFFRRWSDINNEEFSEKEILRKAKRKNSEGSRYTAVNLTNSKTVELRIFRGTIKYPTFMKNIEFAHSVYEFTKIKNKNSISEKEYLEFTKNYKYLNNFLKDKKLCV